MSDEWWYTTFRDKIMSATDEELPILYEKLYSEYLYGVRGHPVHEEATPVSIVDDEVKITDIVNDYRFIRVLIKQFSDDAKILELGCGCSSFSFIMATDGYDVTALDMRQAVVENQRKHIQFLPEEFRDKIRFDCSIAENMSYDDECFDIIVGVDFLEHVRNLDRLLIVCIKVLKPDGKMFFATPIKGIAWSPEHLHNFTEESLRELFNRFNLKTVFHMERYHWSNMKPNVLIIEVIK